MADKKQQGNEAEMDALDRAERGLLSIGQEEQQEEAKEAGRRRRRRRRRRRKQQTLSPKSIALWPQTQLTWRTCFVSPFRTTLVLLLAVVVVL